MLILNSPQIVQETILRWKQEETIAFVPTMGCLHEGHLALVKKAKTLAPKVVVSIFVNPLQFGPTEDLAAYPRPFEEDVEKLESENVDLLFHPTPRDLYPEGFATKVMVGDLGRHLCGASRPGHFDGVTTVCMKLFQITQANFAVFGEKDFQQLKIIERMSKDLNLPLTIVPHPTFREEDGLAMSSRNRYLSPDERQIAPRFMERLRETKARFTAGERAIGSLLETAKQRLESDGFVIDYLAIASERDLNPMAPTETLSDADYLRLFGAVKLGKTRLIDNLSLEEDSRL